MQHSEINKFLSDVKNLVSNDRTESALENLKEFIFQLEDDELENQVLLLSKRYKQLQKEKIFGILNEGDKTEYNAIGKSILLILNEAKLIANEKATLEVGEKLSELAKEGESAIEELKKLTYIMAESRLLELQVFRSYMGTFFSEQDVENFDRNINSLRKVLGKKEGEDIIDKPNINKEELMLRVKSLKENISPNEVMGMINQLLKK